MLSLGLNLNIAPAISVASSTGTPPTTSPNGFNNADKDGSITLSNAGTVGYLTAVNSGSTAARTVRTINSYSTGKYALRFNVDVARGWYGFENGSQGLSAYPSNMFCLAHDGSMFVGSGSASSLSAPANGDTVDVLIDADNKKGWLRKNGTWHTTCGDPTASGVGFDLSSMTFPLYGFFLGNDAGSQTTLQPVTIAGFTSI